MILISPFAQKLRNGMPNPKSPPLGWWRTLIGLLDAPVVQIGVTGEPQLVADFRQNLPLDRIREAVRGCRTWISPDSFLPHLAHHVGKRGVVIWSRSDPRIFGYEENQNVLKSLAYLRKNPFGVWEEETYIPDAFPHQAAVAAIVQEILRSLKREEAV